MNDNGKAQVPSSEIPTPVEEAPATASQSNPMIRGQLTPQRMKLVQSLRAAGRDVVQQIGMCEVRKARLLTDLASIEARNEAVMTEEAKRVGVPEGAPFQVTPEGAILMVNLPEMPDKPLAEG